MATEASWWKPDDPAGFSYAPSTELYVWTLSAPDTEGHLRADLFKAFDESTTWTLRVQGLAIHRDTGIESLQLAQEHAVESITSFIAGAHILLVDNE